MITVIIVTDVILKLNRVLTYDVAVPYARAAQTDSYLLKAFAMFPKRFKRKFIWCELRVKCYITYSSHIKLLRIYWKYVLYQPFSNPSDVSGIYFKYVSEITISSLTKLKNCKIPEFFKHYRNFKLALEMNLSEKNSNLWLPSWVMWHLSANQNPELFRWYLIRKRPLLFNWYTYTELTIRMHVFMFLNCILVLFVGN